MFATWFLVICHLALTKAEDDEPAASDSAFDTWKSQSIDAENPHKFAILSGKFIVNKSVVVFGTPINFESILKLNSLLLLFNEKSLKLYITFLEAYNILVLILCVATGLLNDIVLLYIATTAGSSPPTLIGFV